MSVIRVAREGASTQHQSVFVRYHYRTLDAKLIGVFGFALGDALNLRSMPCVKLVLVASLLGLNVPKCFPNLSRVPTA